MQNPKYITAYETSFSLERADGTLRAEDRDGPTDLLPKANVGEFGPVQPFDLALDVRPTSELVKTVSRLQAKAELLEMGLLDQVAELVAARMFDKTVGQNAAWH